MNGMKLLHFVQNEFCHLTGAGEGTLCKLAFPGAAVSTEIKWHVFNPIWKKFIAINILYTGDHRLFGYPFDFRGFPPAGVVRIEEMFHLAGFPLQVCLSFFLAVKVIVKVSNPLKQLSSFRNQRMVRSRHIRNKHFIVHVAYIVERTIYDVFETRSYTITSVAVLVS